MRAKAASTWARSDTSQRITSGPARRASTVTPTALFAKARRRGLADAAGAARDDHVFAGTDLSSRTSVVTYAPRCYRTDPRRVA